MTEAALQEIKDNLTQLHVDVAFAEKNRMRWIFLIMWLVLADLIHNLFNLGAVLSLIVAALVVSVFRLVDRLLIYKGVSQSEDFLKSIKEKGNQ